MLLSTSLQVCLCCTISTQECMHVCLLSHMPPPFSRPPIPVTFTLFMRHRIVHRCHCWCCDRVSSSECDDIRSWLWSWSDSTTCLPEDIQTNNKYVFLFVNKYVVLFVNKYVLLFMYLNNCTLCQHCQLQVLTVCIPFVQNPLNLQKIR